MAQLHVEPNGARPKLEGAREALHHHTKTIIKQEPGMLGF
jgi:hypothetical protein